VTDMDIKKIQAEVDKVGKSTFAKKTDKQLLSYEILSELHKRKNKESQPNSLNTIQLSNRKTMQAHPQSDCRNHQEIQSSYFMGNISWQKSMEFHPTLFIR